MAAKSHGALIQRLLNNLSGKEIAGLRGRVARLFCTETEKEE